MLINIDTEKFQAGHEAFKWHMLKSSGGVPFVNFQHPFLLSDEVDYKWKVFYAATDLLMLKHWRQWQKKPGMIVYAVKAACRKSGNLLEHKYGPQRYSEAALYKVKGVAQTKELERHLFDFFLESPSALAEFATRFDNLANHLRESKLGCRWDFLSYLAFLLQPRTYFTLRSTYFDGLLKFYGVDERISGQVSWERYKLLLDLADVIKSKLAMYGQPDAVEIQSYMWVVSYLIKRGKIGDRQPAVPDFTSELDARNQRAKERERIGLLGEQLVYDSERNKLLAASRADLAKRVRMMSFGDEGSGYDILSFKLDGTELHIEVKTTVRSRDDDFGFWLSDSEKSEGETDACWTVYRVWSLDKAPHCKDIGNIVLNGTGNWQLKASTWFVERRTIE